MARIDELWTLEDLFYNVEPLGFPDITRWVEMRHPGISHDERNTKVRVIQQVYLGWKNGVFFLDGDRVGMRRWHGGSVVEQL